MQDVSQLLRDYRLTTAEILYHLPDYPDLLQTFLWQAYDLAPQFPVLHKFLHFWHHNLDGRLHSIILAQREIILPSDWRGTHVCLTVQ